MLRNGAPLGHLSHQRKWGSRERRSHNFWPFSPHCRLPLINQTEGPQLGKERGLSWPYLLFGHPLDKTGQNRWTSNNRRRYAIAHWKAIRQYGHKIWFDQPTHAHGVPSLPMRKTPLGCSMAPAAWYGRYVLSNSEWRSRTSGNKILWSPKYMNKGCVKFIHSQTCDIWTV